MHITYGPDFVTSDYHLFLSLAHDLAVESWALRLVKIYCPSFLQMRIIMLFPSKRQNYNRLVFITLIIIILFEYFGEARGCEQRVLSIFPENFEQ